MLESEDEVALQAYSDDEDISEQMFADAVSNNSLEISLLLFVMFIYAHC